MSRKAQLKFGVFVAAVIVAIPAAALAVALLTQFVAAFQQGANPASIFHGHTLHLPAAAEARWLSVDGAALSPAEQEEILAAYWAAWEAFARAQTTGDTSDLLTYWAGPAYQQALAGMASPRAITHHGHHLRLTFLSDDGSVVAFDDAPFSLTEDSSTALTASASVVMTLDQGFWRVRVMTLRYDHDDLLH